MGERLFETERLIIQKIDTSYAQFIVSLLNTKNFLQFVGDRGLQTEEDGVKYIENVLIPRYQMGEGYGSFVMVLKESQMAVGVCGILKREYLDWPDVGYMLLGEYEGCGYVREAVCALLEYAREVMMLEKVYAVISVENERSVSVVRHSGFVLEERDDVNDLIYSKIL